MIYHSLSNSLAGTVAGSGNLLPKAQAEHTPRKRMNSFIYKKSDRNVRKSVNIEHVQEENKFSIPHIVIPSYTSLFLQNIYHCLCSLG